ncbi:hypothetical protein [Aeoliella sp.]|uniref:hypothetical protein n=1 Tax=Aeoliella sp. TaxID=2795800 RepID=UPI003CCBBDAF
MISERIGADLGWSQDRASNGMHNREPLMFNLIVSGNGEAWEKPPLTMDRGRFGEYSDIESLGISLKEPATLQVLVGIPTLLMYELGASGENVRLVRYGRLTKIEATGRYLHFDFEPDATNGYLSRTTVQEFSAELGMQRFEDHRTHWAVKDGDIPDDIVSRGTPAPPERDIKLVSSEYGEAVGNNNQNRVDVLRDEIRAFPASLEQATEFVRRDYESVNAFEAMSHLGIERKHARKAVELALEPAKLEDLKRHRPFSLVTLLEDFGGPTESARIDDVVDHCETLLRGILARPSTTAVAANDLRPLWQCVRSHTLTLRLRRVLNSLIAKFSGFQADGGYWVSSDMPDRRTTAMMAVMLQRLGNDSHRTSIRDAVIWLCRHPDYNDFLSGSSDVVAATLTCEAVRRSGMLSQLDHITDATDSWILASQSPMGEWRSEGWEHVDTTVLVLDYFSQASSMLEQVDGFLLSEGRGIGL